MRKIKNNKTWQEDLTQIVEDVMSGKADYSHAKLFVSAFRAQLKAIQIDMDICKLSGKPPENGSRSCSI